MKMGAKELARLPEHLQMLFYKLPNHGSEEVVGAFPETHVNQPGNRAEMPDGYGGGWGPRQLFGYDTAGSAARFFYSAKADSNDRIGSKHPTVKPVDLMRWLCRLITPPGGTILDPFAGTGTTGEAAFYEGFRSILVEREAEYQLDIARRMTLALAGPDEKQREIIKAKGLVEEPGPLFATPQGSDGHERAQAAATRPAIAAQSESRAGLIGGDLSSE